jgi:hypothetical protein
MLGPIGLHAYYEESGLAVEAALTHAETTIDAGGVPSIGGPMNRDE